MRVLILSSMLFTPEKGVIPEVDTIKDTMIYNLCLGFLKLGHEITLAAADEYRPRNIESYDFDVLFFRSSLKYIFPPSKLIYSSEETKWITENHKNFDIIITGETFSMQTLTVARICPEKTIIWQELCRHQNFMMKLPSKIWYNIVTRFFMRSIRCVIPRSEFAYQFITKYMPMTKHVIVDHGVNIDKFQYSKEKKRYIISSSQLIYRKNVDGIIRIFSDFHKSPKYSDIKLLIAGRGNMESELKSMVSELGISDYVDFLGFLPQKKLNEYIRSSMAFLINTRRDLNIVSIPESICSGTPVLTNLQPSSAGYIQKFCLGIAKNDWGIEELNEIIDNNSIYVDNCVSYREKLTNTYSAKLLVESFDKLI